MRIIITGTPCTGKTSVSEILGKKLKIPVAHVTELVKTKKLGRKKGGEIEVNLSKLKKELLKTNGIIEGHLLCEFGLPNSIVFVLRCDPRVLEKRMKKRGYLKKKIKENLECEALDYCTIRAEKNYGRKKVFDVDATKRKPTEVTGKILSIMRGKSKPDIADYSGWLLCR